MAWDSIGKSLLFNVGETSDLGGLRQPSEVFKLKCKVEEVKAR